MHLTIPKKNVAQPNDDDTPTGRRWNLPSWLFCWELYLIVLVAALLRLYRINATEFDMDQANIFGMAYYALHHGLLVATSNLASIGLNNPPGIIYLLMLPAALSTDPLWGAVMVALCAILSVLLTYVFVSRHYGRPAGAIAAGIYATASLPIFYSRFMWQQNFLLLFVLLYLMTLFRGVVERRKGWLFPVILLQGVLFQLHGSTIYLAPLLVIALVLAPWRTIRWRDPLLGVVSLVVIYFPWLLWELHVHFSDIHILLHPTDQPARVDDQAWIFYRLMISPYNLVGPHSLLALLVPWIKWLRQALIVLVVGGAALALVQAVWSRTRANQENKQTFLRTLWRWWTELRADPYRCGLIILVAWQVVPLLLLRRHAIDLYPHYTIIFLPGQFILVGYLLINVAQWLQKLAKWGPIIRFAPYVLALLIVIAQLAGSTASVLDAVRGNFVDPVLSNPYYTPLSAYQHAVTEADQLAQQRHLSRVYISADSTMQSSFRYLATQMHTPTTVFNDSCVVLPNPANGPSVLLVGAYSDFTNALVSHFANATLVDKPQRPGSVPFSLYIINPETAQPSANATFANDLQFLNAAPFSYNGKAWLVTRWNMLRAAQPDYLTTYTYKMTGTPTGAGSLSSQCTFTAIRSGDQLLAPFKLPTANSAYASLAINGQYYATLPYNLPYGPFSFETDVYQSSSYVTLRTPGGRDSITVSAAKSS
jgi:4-amino-4-deoxy-L-arabinose transferase-like glycosyltransferase